MSTRFPPLHLRGPAGSLLREKLSTVPGELQGNALAGIGYSLAQSVWGQSKAAWRNHRTWTVTVPGDDDLFFDAQLWLMDTGQHETRRSISARTVSTSQPGESWRTEVRFLADDNVPQEIMISGFKVKVYVDDEGSTSPGDQKSGSKTVRPPRLVFTSKTRAGRDAVLDELRAIRDRAHREKRSPGLMVLDKWGDWTRRADLPARPMESVIVKGDVVEALRQDLDEFINRESDYVRLAIPYHRAYLLVGPPGTGKTSAARAISNALGLDLWYAQLSGIDRDTKLSDVLGEVRARNVLLLEDIDSLPAAVDRTEENAATGDISTSGLLNALDGVATPHGLVTILTTNHPDRLDPALMRPGRIDRVFEFEIPDRETLRRHFVFFYGRAPRHVDGWAMGRSSAAVSEVFKQHMDDPDGADLALIVEPVPGEEENWHARADVTRRRARPALASLKSWQEL